MCVTDVTQVSEDETGDQQKDVKESGSEEQSDVTQVSEDQTDDEKQEGEWL